MPPVTRIPLRSSRPAALRRPASLLLGSGENPRATGFGRESVGRDHLLLAETKDKIVFTQSHKTQGRLLERRLAPTVSLHIPTMSSNCQTWEVREGHTVNGLYPRYFPGSPALSQCLGKPPEEAIADTVLRQRYPAANVGLDSKRREYRGKGRLTRSFPVTPSTALSSTFQMLLGLIRDRPSEGTSHLAVSGARRPPAG